MTKFSRVPAYYPYTREEFARKHTWKINVAGRSILPVMQAVARLPGGHRPLNFVHRLADGSLRVAGTLMFVAAALVAARV